MNDKEAIEMMNRCKNEIIELRRQNAVLGPKAEAYDNITAILCLLPQRSVGMSQDLVWELEKCIRELQPKQEEGNAITH